MQYFIIVNGSQAGPFSKEELRLQNITPQTLVWHEGMTEWTPAEQVPDVVDLFSYGAAAPVPPVGSPSMANPPVGNPNPSYPGNQPYGQPQNPYNSYGQNPYGNQPIVPTPHTNWMAWAIVATIIGFCSSCIGGIIGIFAIVSANKANNYYNMGMDAQGDANNSSAKTLTIIAIVLDIIGIFVSIAYFSYYASILSSLNI